MKYSFSTENVIFSPYKYSLYRYFGPKRDFFRTSSQSIFSLKVSVSWVLYAVPTQPTDG